MTSPHPVRPRSQVVAAIAYFGVAVAFFAYLFQYYLTSAGGPTLLAFTLVPITYILFVLDALRNGGLYPRFGMSVNCAIAVVYSVACLTITGYMYIEFEAIGTVRAGTWSLTDLFLGGLMFVLVMEYARKRYFILFLLNVALILYAVYGWIVPGMFYHPGLSWTRIVSSMSVEDTTGVYSSLPQLALTLIGSFVLVLSVLRAFGCIDSILKGASSIAARSPHALPQAAVIGSFGVAAVSGSGAANAVTTGSATIPALIKAGMSRTGAASIETAASLGGQLMPPIMGISAFLMADFLGRSYFDVVARGYVPALIYFAGVSLGVYMMSIHIKTKGGAVTVQRMDWHDWTNLGAFVAVVIGLVVLMAVAHLPPMFAAIDVFALIGAFVLARTVVVALNQGGWKNLRHVAQPILRFVDNFASMTAELTLLLATLSILTSALVNTGIPVKVGFILVDAAAISFAAMAIVAFAFGALLGMGLPPAPTYILTALVIAPSMIKAGADPWAVHFFAFFLAVWGELTPPTSVVAAVTSKIAEASFLGTLMGAIKLCSTLFILMVAVFTRPALVQEPGLQQLAAMALVLMVAIGMTFSLQARFSHNRATDAALRAIMAGAAFIVLFHPDQLVAALATAPIIALAGYWLLRRRKIEAEADRPRAGPASGARPS